MLNEFIANFVRYVFLILTQGLVLNNVALFDGRAVPYLYVLFLLSLPFEIPRWLELLIGFITGLTIDFFTSTPGMHASACVLLAYMRPLLLKALAPREGYEFGTHPTIRDMGFRWYASYAAILIVAHHLWLFYLEAFSFDNFFLTLLRVLLSSAFTFILVILSQYLAFGSSRRRI